MKAEARLVVENMTNSFLLAQAQRHRDNVLRPTGIEVVADATPILNSWGVPHPLPVHPRRFPPRLRTPARTHTADLFANPHNYNGMLAGYHIPAFRH